MFKWTIVRIDEGETLTVFLPDGKQSFTHDNVIYKYVFMCVQENVVEVKLTDVNDLETKKVFSKTLSWIVE